MDGQRDNSENIEYIVGAEKGLRDIITGEEMTRLLESAVRAGISEVMVMDTGGKILWSCGVPVKGSSFNVEMPVYIEGEIVGKIAVGGETAKEDYIKGLSGLLLDTINMMAYNNLKRMLTTETHTKVVNESYEELLETNRRLSLSEGRYRELAENLEIKVGERTEELKRAYTRLLQQEKMASIGQLAAGVAHEINNPLGFISSNISTLKRYFSRFGEMLAFYRSAVKGNKITGETGKISEQKWSALKLDFISSDIDELIGQSLQGVERVKKIVSDLKGFSHIDEGDESVADINAEIDRTLNVLAFEIPEGTEIIRDYHPLPGFACNPALICQVFLNIILNSLQARRKMLRLVITTDLRDNNILIRFSDNGPGIPEEVRGRIFEPFYTTKDVGKGMGMGLTVAYEIVTSHRGTIEVEGRPGEGATFIISLPVKRGRDV